MNTKNKTLSDWASQSIKPRPCQQEMFDAIDWFVENELPIRIIYLGGRQDGKSTAVMTAMNWFADKHPDGWLGLGYLCDDMLQNLRSMADDKKRFYEFHTECGNPSRSTALKALCITEAAYCSENGLAASMLSVPDEKDTMIILESNDHFNLFTDNFYHEATTLEVAKKQGVSRPGYIRVAPPATQLNHARILGVTTFHKGQIATVEAVNRSGFAQITFKGKGAPVSRWVDFTELEF